MRGAHGAGVGGDMRIELVVGQALEGATGFRHLLAPESARVSWAACGVLGLAQRLGQWLGVPVAVAPRSRRVAAWRGRLERRISASRFFAESFAHDPVGVTDHLLGLRDALRWAGWDGRTLEGSDRLDDLSALESLDGTPPPSGPADLVLAVTAALRGPASLPFEVAVRLVEPPSRLPAAGRRLLGALCERGVPVVEPAADRPRAEKGTDLGRLQRTLIGEPPAPLSGDGTVVLFEAESAHDAAALVASWRRAHPAADEAWVVGAEAGVLDVGRRRHGLPTLGSVEASRTAPAMQVLPLRLALAFSPRDAEVAAELLSLPDAPLPRWVRRALLAALAEAPGVGGPVWLDAVNRCLEIADRRDPERPARLARALLTDQITAWLDGPTFDPATGIPAGHAVAICERVARWARSGDRAAAARVAGALADLLRARPPEARMARMELARLHDVALGEAVGDELSPAEAGRPAVARHPAGVVGAPAEVVWWGLVGPVRVAAPPTFTGGERRALAARGVELSPPGAAREAEAWAWRRPLLAARERLVLVAWRRAGRERAEPHPCLDELGALLPPGALTACRRTDVDALLGAAWAPPTEPLASWPAVAPRALWRLPGASLMPEGELSFSRIDRLLSCPLRSVLHDAARLRRAGPSSLPDGPRLVGRFAHALLQDVLDDDELGADEAAERARALFDARVETEAAPLLRPGREEARARARDAIAAAARVLVAVIRAGGWRSTATEVSCAGTFAGRRYAGRVDLVLRDEGRQAVLDLKLGRADRQRERLARGDALQLALYARALAPPAPATAFLTVEGGRLMTTDAGAFAGATHVAGPTGDETLDLAERAWARWARILGAGLVPARGLPPADWAPACAEAAGETAPREGPGAAEAPCRFCEYRVVCHARVEAMP